MNIFANYTYSPKQLREETDKATNFINSNNDIFSRWTTVRDEVSTSDAHNINATLDYEIDEKNSINFTTNLLFNQNQEAEQKAFVEIRNAQNVLDSTFSVNNFDEKDNTNFAFDLSYVHKLKKPGAQLSLNGHYTKYAQDESQDFLTSYFDSSGGFLRDFGFRTDAFQNIDILTGQLDFASPLGNASIETGLKASLVDSESSIDFSNFIGSDESVSSALSDNFVYDEQVYAAYASFVKNWDKFSMKLGVRGEYANALGKSLTLGEANRQEFFEPFPTVYLLYSPNDTHSFAFDYGRNVDRPKYNDLNPFRIFFNENDFLEGNPSLQPNFSHNFNLNYTLNSEFFFDFYYRDNGNQISEISFQDNTALTLRELRQNLIDSNSYGIDFTVSKSILDPWFLYAYSSVFHEDQTFLAVESGNQEFTNEVDGFYLYLANYFTLSGDGTLTGEATFNYLSTFIFGSYVQSPVTNFTLGLRKTLWNNRAVLSVTAEDLLGKANATYTSRYINQDNTDFTIRETQFIRVGFTYNFGNFRLENNEKSIDKRERDRLQTED